MSKHVAYEGLCDQITQAIRQCKAHFLIGTAVHLQLALSQLRTECEEWDRINAATPTNFEGLSK